MRGPRAAWTAAVALLLGCAPRSSPAPGPPPGETVEPPAAVALDGLEVHGDFDFDWRVRTADGLEVPLERFRGRVIVLNLWATWCPPCVAELGSFERLARALESTDVVILPVSPEEPSAVRSFLQRHGPGLPLLTEATRAPSSLGPLVLPTTFVVDRAGRIVLRHRGASRWDDPAVVAFLTALAASGAGEGGG